VNNLISFWLSGFDPRDNGIAIIGAYPRYVSVVVDFRTGSSRAYVHVTWNRQYLASRFTPFW